VPNPESNTPPAPPEKSSSSHGSAAGAASCPAEGRGKMVRISAANAAARRRAMAAILPPGAPLPQTTRRPVARSSQNRSSASEQGLESSSDRSPIDASEGQLLLRRRRGGNTLHRQMTELAAHAAGQQRRSDRLPEPTLGAMVLYHHDRAGGCDGAGDRLGVQRLDAVGIDDRD